MQPPNQISPTPTFGQALGVAMQEHLYRAKLICYSLLLLVGGTQIVIREQFPNLQPPWRIIGSVLIVVLFGVVFVPPVVKVIRDRKTPNS